MQASVPSFIGVEVGMSTLQSLTENWGAVISTEEDFIVEAAVKVPPRKFVLVEIIATRSKLRVNYTATFKTYRKGEFLKRERKEGVFENVNFCDQKVIYHPSRPINEL